MVRGVHCSGSTGLLSSCTLTIVAFALAYEYNSHVECDRMFVSNPNGPRNGTFVSPTFKNPQNHSHQCIYTFIAAANERIQITFTSFNLRGTPPECNHEYLDLYTEIEDPNTDLIITPFGGRYCGRIPPRKRISLYQTLVIGFYTDKQSSEDVFQGMYEFIDASRYQIGTAAPHSTCGFTIHSEHKRDGEFVSPTYPGVYPKSLTCSYTFLGKAGQRVRLEFMDFDLFYGGRHCPFDYVKVYDGTSTDDPLIGTYCGQERNLVVYSSAENLYVQFITLQRTADSQNRGFSGRFEFSEKYVNLECDQKILSKKESNGTVYSPNYPFLYHPNTICRYFIYGMQDMQNLERVRLEFEKFEIPGTDSECKDGYLKLYLRGQEAIQAYDKDDHSFCGRTLPPSLVSEGPRLVMIFNSGNTEGQGFKARYIFETEYQVPGTPAPDGSCNFSYLSTSRAVGDFNSPRHPANYPSNLTCTYTLRGSPGEQVKLVFDHFKIKPLYTSQYGNSCQNDWIEVYNVYPDESERLLGRYCGTKAPGPTISEYGTYSLRVLFHTDKDDVASGFKARYTFQPSESEFGDCGQNISGTEDGVLMSPNHPNGYLSSRQICNWYIYVKPNHRVLLHFTHFELEGDQNVDGRGCPSAVVRVWKSLTTSPIEICGTDISEEVTQIHSDSNIMKISFITADKAVGAKGFKAVWTEIKEGPRCDRFHCATNGFCISKLLKCNDVPNCGMDDHSDEEDCGEPSGMNLYLLIGLIIGVTTVVLLGICIWCHRKHKRRRNEQPPQEARHRHVCDAAVTRFSSVDSV